MSGRALLIFATMLMAGCGRAQNRDNAAADTGTVSDTVRATDTAGTGRAPPVADAPKTIDAVLAAHTDSLLAVPGVLGTAVGRCSGAPCIRVLVSRVTDEIRRRVPPKLEGYPVHIDVTGPVVPR